MTEPITQDQDTTLTTITDVNQFASILLAWHSDAIAHLHHFMAIPEGTEASVDETDTVILQGEALKGFKAGIITALGLVGKTPFSFSLEDAPSESSTEG